MTKGIDRRGFLRVTGSMSLGALVLSACEGGGSDDDGTLDVWAAFGTDAQKEYYEENILAAFNESQNGVTVQLSVKQIATIDRLLQTAMAAGQGPDIVPTPGPSYAAAYVDAGQFLALDDLAEEHGWTDRLLPWALATGTIDDTLYSIPSAYESMILLYNPATFDSNGWTPPTNLAEFEAICSEAAGMGMMPVAAGNAEWKPANEWHVTNVFNAAAGAEALAGALAGDVPWTDSRFVGAIELLKGWFDEGWFGGDVEEYFTEQVRPALRRPCLGRRRHDADRLVGHDRDRGLLRRRGRKRRDLGLGAAAYPVGRPAAGHLPARGRLHSLDQRAGAVALGCGGVHRLPARPRKAGRGTGRSAASALPGQTHGRRLPFRR